MSARSELLSVGIAAADYLATFCAEQGSPVPWPDSQEDIPNFVEQMVPYGRSAVGAMADGPVAFKKVDAAVIDEGFRERFTRLVVASLSDE